MGTRLNHTGGSPRISEDAWSEYVGVGKPRIDPAEAGPEATASREGSGINLSGGGEAINGRASKRERWKVEGLRKSSPCRCPASGLGPVKIKERIEDEGDVDEGGEHHVEFFKA